MSDLATLRPTGLLRVMDLVREAGVDVSDWSNYAGGATKAASNPRYCYEWAFIQPGKVVVLNVWYRDICEHRGVITLTNNFRASALRHARDRSGASVNWCRRAQKVDDAVRLAASERLPVRLIICDGIVRRLAEERASQVTARMLDPVPWAVTSYDPATGAFTLTRGDSPRRLVDQFDVGQVIDSPMETRTVTGGVFVRDARVRAAVLTRAAGRCEWCQQPGFTTPSGEVFLETHHIIPLSENGADTILNVAALCPNHHREAHYGAARGVMRERLLAIAGDGGLPHQRS